MEELLNLIIFAVLILVSSLFGAKKKKQPPGTTAVRKPPRPPPQVPPRMQQQGSPRPTTTSEGRPRSLPEDRPQHPAPAVRTRQPPPVKKPESFKEFFELLQQQAEAVTQPEVEIVVEQPVMPPPPVRREPRVAETIETLEPAGGASHKRFHDQYIRPLPGLPVKLPPHFRLPRDSVSLKRAVVWSEILGRPKGLE